MREAESWSRSDKHGVKKELEEGGARELADWRVRERGNRYVSAMTHQCWIFIASGGGGSYVGMEEPVGGRANGLGGGQDGISGGVVEGERLR